MTLKYLSNTYDPRRPDARKKVIGGLCETEAESWQRYQDWLRDKIIGEPQATKFYTTAELRAMGMVGIYVEETTP